MILLWRSCLLLSLAVLLSNSNERCRAADAKRPNVIVVLADDLGIGDTSPTNPNCKIKTPNLQKLADEGMTFHDAHSPSSVCTPTRYGLLTGRYNWRSTLAKGVLSGTSEHLIPADRATLGHLMRDAGYHTSMIGKWHLGWDWNKVDGVIDFSKPIVNGPDINGFDQYYAHCGSLDMPPYVWVDSGRATQVPQREEGVTAEENKYAWYRKGPISDDFKIDEVLPHLFGKATSLVNDRAEASKAGTPFFLYLPLPSPHTPIVPLPPFKDASGINPYADFVMQVDHHMGELMTCLKAAGIDDNTLVFFTSDNGCSPQADFDVLAKHGHNPSRGYRGHKADIYEGGHRVPFLVRWPDQVPAGTNSNALVCLTDIYATLESIVGTAGGSPSRLRGGEDSFSLLPVFNGAETSQRETLVSHSIEGAFAIRHHQWKLCLASGSAGWSEPKEAMAIKQGLPPIQLFNLETDPEEKSNLATTNPEKVKELVALLDAQVQDGRATKGERVANDREIKYMSDTASAWLASISQ